MWAKPRRSDFFQKQLPQDKKLRINRQKRSTETAIIERRTTMEEKKTNELNDVEYVGKTTAF